MKILLFTITVLVAGAILSLAQSNPTSPGGVDTEMQLAWPDGSIYRNQQNDENNDVSLGTNGQVIQQYYDRIDWQETAGGSSADKAINVPYNSDDQCTIQGDRWPYYGGGYCVSLLDGSTNTWGPAPGLSNPGERSGSVNFTFTYTGGSDILQYRDQSQLMLITGGEPGSADSELYELTGSALTETYIQQTFPDPISDGIDPGQIQIGSLGHLTNIGTNGGQGVASGALWVSLPMHSEVSVTPHVGAPYYFAGVTVQPYPLVSQCVAPIPANRARTFVGVGEQVNLSFPTLFIDYKDFVWSTTAGSLSATNGSSTQFTAPNHAGSTTVTAKVFGKPVSLNFKVIEPSGYDHAQLTTTNHYPVGVSGAMMTNLIWIAPTSVSFYRVNIMEVGTDATNISGYFSQWTPQQLHHNTADHWVRLNYPNQFYDGAGSYSNPPPWSAGGYSWDIPAKWQVIDGGATNSMNGWNQAVSIDASGTVTVQKFRHSVTRTVNDIITTQ